MSSFVTTEDGSITLLDESTGELYHNRAGAYTEALRNYVEPSGVLAKINDGALTQVNLLDACFGLGYNTFVFLQSIIDAGHSVNVSVTAVELDAEILRTTEAVLSDTRFGALRTAFGGTLPTHFGSFSGSAGKAHFEVNLVEADLRDCVTRLQTSFDYVFHDPFSPKKVPELWTAEMFAEYYRLLSHSRGAILTYSSAGAVRGALLEAGFHVYKTTPVGAKQGGTLGTTTGLIIASPGVHTLSDIEVAKLRGKSGVPYRDANRSRSRQQIIDERHSEQSLRS